MMDEQDYSQRDIESGVQDGNQWLTRDQYEKAEQAFARARQAALALKVTSRLNKLDQAIQQTRDRAKWYAQVTKEVSALAQETDPLAQLAGLESMNWMIGQMVAMGYQESATLTRSARQTVMASLDPQKIPDLAQVAMEKQDYALVVDLLGGMLVTQDTPAYSLLQRAERILTTDVEPRVAEAIQFLTQSRPLDGMGVLQDLRRAFPQCPAWREPGFMLARAQGAFLLDRGRQNMAEGQYAAAKFSFKEAFQAFELGAEAYPDTCSTQMLLAEAQDLREIAAKMAAAEATLQSGQELDALGQFDAIQARLDALAAEGREYSLIKFEVDLLRQRLGARVERELAARRLIEQATRAMDEGDLERSVGYLEQAKGGPDDVVLKLHQSIREVEIALERQQQQHRMLLDELDSLARQDPARAIQRWSALAKECPNLGALPPGLANKALELVAIHLQQRDWAHAREHLDLLREAGVPASQLANVEAMLARESGADKALAAFQSRFQELVQEGATVADLSALEQEIGHWLSGSQPPTRHDEGQRLLAQVRWELDARKQAAEKESITGQVAALQNRIVSACSDTDWRAIIAEGTALEPNLTYSDQQSQCRAVVDQARAALALYEQAGQSVSQGRQLIAASEPGKAPAILEEAASTAPGQARAEIESLIQATKDEQARRQRLHRMVRQAQQSIEAGDWDRAQQVLIECEGLGLGGQETEIIEKIIQAGVRMAAGRRFLEQGQVDLAIPRLKSAISLAENLPGAEVVLTDAQTWLKWAMKEPETPAPTSAQGSAVVAGPAATTSQVPAAPSLPGVERPVLDMLARMTQWIVEIEPVLVQARAAFVRGDQQTASLHFMSLARGLKTEVDHQSPSKEA